MVCNLTIGRKKYAEVEAEMQDVLARSEPLRAQLTALIHEDSTAFDGVMAAYRMPKATPEEKAARSAAIQEGLKQATYVPLRTLEACVAVLELAPIVVEKGNPNVASDGGAGVLAAHAGMMTAALNVRINLNAIKDEVFVAEAEALMDELLARGDAAREQAWAIASARLGM
jgi:formiminotetrahydrofolate cyclodeaminase